VKRIKEWTTRREEFMAADVIEEALHEYEDSYYSVTKKITTRVQRGEYLLRLAQAIRNEMEGIKEEGP
jgi:predicted DNA-binding protein